MNKKKRKSTKKKHDFKQHSKCSKITNRKLSPKQMKEEKKEQCVESSAMNGNKPKKNI